MAAAKPEPAVEATAVQLGIDLFAWQPRTAKYWQSKVCPYALLPVRVWVKVTVRWPLGSRILGSLRKSNV